MFTLELEPHKNVWRDAPQVTRQSQDRLFATVIKFLIDGEDVEEAQILLTSDFALTIDYQWREYDADEYYYENCGYIIRIACQRKAYDALYPLNELNLNYEYAQKIDWAFRSVLEHDIKYSYTITYSMGSVDMSPGWRERLDELARHGGVEANNQGLGAETSDYFTLWNGLKFRSKTETRIAEALENRAVMYFPLPRARLGLRNSRKTREPDFLVCHKGKWGILEVDGRPYHEGFAADDHERDRLFKQHGVRVIERYKADECFETAGEVVSKFLNLLERLG